MGEAQRQVHNQDGGEAELRAEQRQGSAYNWAVPERAAVQADASRQSPSVQNLRGHPTLHGRRARGHSVRNTSPGIQSDVS